MSARFRALNPHQKLAVAGVLILGACLLIWLRWPESLDKVAESRLRAHIRGDCHAVLGLLTQDEKEATGLTDDELCRFYEEVIFPYTRKMEIQRVLYRRSDSISGSIAVEAKFSNGRSVQVNSMVYADRDHPVSTINHSLTLYLKCRAILGNQEIDKNLFYFLPYLEDVSSKLQSHGIERLYSARKDLVSPKLYVLYTRGDIVYTEKYQKLSAEGMTVNDAAMRLAKDPELKELRRQIAIAEREM